MPSINIEEEIVEQPILITITVMLVALVEVLDITIVNVALPHMMGTLEANMNK